MRGIPIPGNRTGIRVPSSIGEKFLSASTPRKKEVGSRCFSLKDLFPSYSFTHTQHKVLTLVRCYVGDSEQNQSWWWPCATPCREREIDKSGLYDVIGPTIELQGKTDEYKKGKENLHRGGFKG